MEDIVLSENDNSGAKLRKRPEDCTVLELKRWLKCHGLLNSCVVGSTLTQCCTVVLKSVMGVHRVI